MSSGCESDILLGVREGAGTPDGSTGGTGGSDGGSGIGDGSTRTDALTGDPCTDYATTLCELEQSCNLLVFRNLLWGDLAVCKERRRLRCSTRLAARDSNDTPARITACAAAISKFTCDDYGRQEAWPETCGTPAGDLADGAGCAIGAQCKGGACFPAEGTACGACSVLPPLGAACPNGVCSEFLECLSGICVSYLKLNDTCRVGGPLCGYGLACIGAGTTGQGKCLQHLGIGATCDPSFIECNDTIGLSCDPTTSKCRIDPGWPAPGELCLGGQFCRADAWCSVLKRCEPKRREGEACGNSVGAPACLQPATCVSNVCTLPNPTACP
jgi:hypothetical protein